VHAIWNGATDVAQWVVLGGPGAASLRPIAATPWNGLDTAVAVDERPAYVAVVALDAFDRIVGRSEVAALTK
jgi:hypothetical protein